MTTGLDRTHHAYRFIFSFFLLHFLFIPCGRLSWLSVSFFLHVKYTVSYRIVSYRRLTTGIRPAVSRGYGYTRGSGTGRVGFLATGRVPVRVKFLVTGMGRVENLCTRSPLLLIPSGLPLWISGLFSDL